MGHAERQDKEHLDMKLPGVNYQTGVQSRGRHDISAPMRVAQAEANASEAWTRAVHQGVDTTDEILDNIAEDEAIRGMNAYNTAKLAWSAEQNYYDENGEAADANGGARYNNAEEAARAEAMKVVKSTRGQRLFGQRADAANVRYGADWHKKVVGWKKEEDTANHMEAANIYTQQGAYEEANLVIEEARRKGLFSEAQADKARANVMGTEITRGYEARIAASVSAVDLNATRQAIEDDTQISEGGRRALKTALKTHMVTMATEDMREVLTSVEKASIQRGEDGETEAALLGDAIIHQLSMVNDSSIDGADNETRRAILANVRAVQREWQVAANKRKAGRKVEDELACAFSPECRNTIGKSDRTSMFDKGMQAMAGWKVDPETGEYGPTLTDKQLLGKEGAPYRDRMVLFAANTGVVTDYMNDVIDKGLTSRIPEERRAAISMMQKTLVLNPNAIQGAAKGVVAELLPIARLMDLDHAADMWNQYRETKPSDRQAFNELFDKTTVGFNYMGAIKDGLVGTGFVAFFRATPEAQVPFINDVRIRAKHLMPFVGGDAGEAIKTSIAMVKDTYGVDKSTGTARVMQHPPAATVENGNYDGGKWVAGALERAFLAEGIDELPEGLRLQRSPDYVYGTHQKYYAYYMDEEGRHQAVAVIFDFDSTPEAAEKAAKEAAKAQQAADLEALNKVRAAQKEDPSLMVTPDYQREVNMADLSEKLQRGAVDGMTAVGKAYTSAVKGFVSTWGPLPQMVMKKAIEVKGKFDRDAELRAKRGEERIAKEKAARAATLKKIAEQFSRAQ